MAAHPTWPNIYQGPITVKIEVIGPHPWDLEPANPFAPFSEGVASPLAWCTSCRQVYRWGPPGVDVVICGQPKARPPTLEKGVVWTSGMVCSTSLIPWPELDAALILIGADRDARSLTARTFIQDRQREEFLAAEARQPTPAQAEHRQVTLDVLKSKFNRGRR